VASPDDVLTFWFEELTSKDWFGGDKAVDAKVTARFFALVEDLGSATYPHLWEREPESTLALIIALDQFPRNIFRGNPKAFAFDSLALGVSQRFVERGVLEDIPKEKRNWALTPFMHSEELAVQEAGLPLFKAHTDANTYRHAVAHHAVIARIGRFPYRNATLGRQSTDEERAFLDDGGYAPA